MCQVGFALSQELRRPKPQEESAMLKQIAVKPVITASARMTIAEAARAMKQKNVGALIVVNAGRH